MQIILRLLENNCSLQEKRRTFTKDFRQKKSRADLITCHKSCDLQKLTKSSNLSKDKVRCDCFFFSCQNNCSRFCLSLLRTNASLLGRTGRKAFGSLKGASASYNYNNNNNNRRRSVVTNSVFILAVLLSVPSGLVTYEFLLI